MCVPSLLNLVLVMVHMSDTMSQAMKLTSVYEKIAGVYGIPDLFPTNQITVFVRTQPTVISHSGQGTNATWWLRL